MDSASSDSGSSSSTSSSADQPPNNKNNTIKPPSAAAAVTGPLHLDLPLPAPPSHGILKSPRSPAAAAAAAATPGSVDVSGPIHEPPPTLISPAPKQTQFNIITSTSNSSCASSTSDPSDHQLRDQMRKSGKNRVNQRPAANHHPSIRRRRTISGSAPEDHIMRVGTACLYTKGRPPWYNPEGTAARRPMLIGICGGSASGKTTVSEAIIKSLNIPWVTLLCMDSFYKVLTPEQHAQAEKEEYNFDHPDAFDMPLLLETLRKLCDNKCVTVPEYNFTTHSREKETMEMYGSDVIVFEGILSLYDPEIRGMMDLKLFVDTDSDTRLARRLQRDTQFRGRSTEGVIEQYLKHVKPAYDNFIAPSGKTADLIIQHGGENKEGIEIVVRAIRAELNKRGYFSDQDSATCRQALASKNGIRKPMPKSLTIVRETAQTRGLHTFIRNRKTGRDEFIFYSKRLMRILIEEALALLPFSPNIVETPQGTTYEGVKCESKGRVCGVSIMRAGETMEQALREVIKDCIIGKILIQTNKTTQEPELHFCDFSRLPKEVTQYKILLMDATVATGAASIMAIRVLMDHFVPEENIILLSILMAHTGVQSVAYAFPKVKIITTAVDDELSSNYHILPGIGNFGDRYYGTDLDESLSEDEENEGRSSVADEHTTTDSDNPL